MAVDDLMPPQYGTSMHYPSCIVGSCTGCLPPLPDHLADPEQPKPFDPSLFRLELNAPIATRPRDWAPAARAILRERGAWRT